MKIKKNTPMMLFRYSEYEKYDFAEEHLKVLEESGTVWMMKVGRRNHIGKIERIIDNEGFLILKQPKKKGGKFYICKMIEVSNKKPTDGIYPYYYEELIKESLLFSPGIGFQFFKLVSFEYLPNEHIDKIILEKTGEKILDVISSTRTAVMFVRNEEQIVL